MSVRLEKAWISCTPENIAAVPGHMGVFQLGDETGEVLYIGYAGGHSLFGLRGELDAKAATSAASRFRYEVNTACLTRYRELLMAHIADHGRLPRDNAEDDARGLGRLSPG